MQPGGFLTETKTMKHFHDMVDKMILKRETGERLFIRPVGTQQNTPGFYARRLICGALKLSSRPLLIPRCKNPCYDRLISIKNWYSAPSFLQKIILNFPSTINRRENIKTKKLSTYPIFSDKLRQV